jgi:hypothetical protein
MGAAEQLATTTASIFNLRSGRQELKDLSSQNSENTRLILLLCFTNALYALYSFIVYSPIIRVTFFSTSSMKASALWPSLSLVPNFGKGTSCVAQLTLNYTISLGVQP